MGQEVLLGHLLGESVQVIRSELQSKRPRARHFCKLASTTKSTFLQIFFDFTHWPSLHWTGSSSGQVTYDGQSEGEARHSPLMHFIIFSGHIWASRLIDKTIRSIPS